MLLKVFSVYDVKVGAYLPPLFFRSKLEAIRAFSSAVADSQHQFCQHPEDYTLFELGEWDDGDAKFKANLTVIPLVTAMEVSSKVNDNVQQIA